MIPLTKKQLTSTQTSSVGIAAMKAPAMTMFHWGNLSLYSTLVNAFPPTRELRWR